MSPRPVPELPALPDLARPGGSDPAGGRGTASAAPPVAVIGVLLLLALAAVPAWPTGTLIAVAALMLVAVAVLGEAAPPEGGPLLPGPADAVAGPYDHEDAGTDHLGDAGAYYYDRQGRPRPIDDAF